MGAWDMEKVAITQFVQEFGVVWHQKDAKAFSMLLIPDGEWNDIIGNKARGREAVEKQHIFPFGNMLKDAQLTLGEAAIKMIRPDVASVEVKWVCTDHTTPNGAPLPPREGLMHLVVIKEDGKWWIAVGYNQDATSTYIQSLKGKVPMNQEITGGK